MALTIKKVVWLVGLHSIVHGVLGIVFILTSHYVNYKASIITAFVAVHAVLICLGILIFFVVVFRRPLCVKIFAVLFLITALSYLIIGLIYFIKYFPFYANSILDEAIYYTKLECWVGPDYMMTFWHILAALFLLFILLWFVYAILLCRLAHCVCFLPCPPDPCAKVCEPAPCCKVKWYKKLFKGKCCPPPVCPPICPPPCPPPPPPCPPPPPPPPPCPPPPCPTPSCPPPPPPPSPPCPPPPPSTGSKGGGGKKSPKFVLTLKPGKICK